MKRSVRPMVALGLGLLLLGFTPRLYAAQDPMVVVDRIVRQHLRYIYGSEDMSKGGLDCSGFVQVVFREAAGAVLPDEADKQLAYVREHGQVWDSTSGWTPGTLQPGDLIFFAGPYDLPRASRISHVMIYCGNGVMAGAQGGGRQIGGGISGVGYYRFPMRHPAGVWGESGERFIGHRKVFAYGRLSGVKAKAPVVLQPVMAGTNATVTPSGAVPGLDWKVVLVNPWFD